ncbi:transcription factor bHLH18-like [Impatiens glandulifera]|uniref:transcription factor bHLH18-like n=1 Tax=Impatiens glandulifera TaxID=253017 RepID=UPI001FB11726|nr:transcription factor bHLH18-like [Impatiens glandulifera]
MRTYEEDPCGGEHDDDNIHSQGILFNNLQEEENLEEDEDLEEEEDNSSIISEHFSRLTSMLPGLPEDAIIDQDNIIKSTIEHIEKLRHDQANIQERVNRNINARRSSVDNVVSAYMHESSSSGQENIDQSIPIVKVISNGNNVLIKIHCKEEKGNLSRITDEIDKFNLSIVNMNSLPFEDYIDITFITMIRDGLSMKLKDIVSALEVLLSE